MTKKYTLDEQTALEKEISDAGNLGQDEKIKKLQEIIKREPEFSGSYNTLGEIYWDAKDYQHAIESYTLAAKYSAPEATMPHLRLAQIYAEQKDAAHMFESLKNMMTAEVAKVAQFKKDGLAITWKKDSELVWDKADFNRFKPYQADPELAKICPPPHQAPAGLEKLYEAAKNDSPNVVLKEGESLLKKKPADILAVLDPMLYMLKRINSDLDEHGETNLYLYDKKKTVQDYIEYEKKIADMIADAKKEGATSSTFKDFMGDAII